MKRLAVLVFTLFTALAGTDIAHAQSYATRAVNVIVPYPPGGPTDQVARQITPKLADTFKQSFIVENISGGGTNIAGARVARAAPDGHTVMIHNLQISANVSLYKALPFDVEKDLAVVTMLNNNPLVLVARKEMPATTLPELVAWMKTHTAKMGHPGTGSTGHLITFLLAQAMGVKVDHIPYRGAAPMLQDALGGHIDVTFATPQQVVGLFRSGQIKVFGITSKEPSPLFPGVPSLVKELGPKLEVLFWHAMFVPAATPQPIIAALNQATNAAMDDPALLKAWADSAVAPYPREQRTPAGAAAYLKQEIAHWGQVVRDNNIEAPTN